MPSNSTVSPAGAGMRPTFVDDDMMGAVLMSLTISSRPGLESRSLWEGGGGWSELKSRAACRSTQHQAGTSGSLSDRAFLGPTTLSIMQCHRSGQCVFFTFWLSLRPPPPGRGYTRASGSTLQQVQLFFSIKEQERRNIQKKSNSARHDATHRRSLTPSSPKRYAFLVRRTFRQPRYDYFVIERQADGRKGFPSNPPSVPSKSQRRANANTLVPKLTNKSQPTRPLVALKRLWRPVTKAPPPPATWGLGL